MEFSPTGGFREEQKVALSIHHPSRKDTRALSVSRASKQKGRRAGARSHINNKSHTSGLSKSKKSAPPRLQFAREPSCSTMYLNLRTNKNGRC
jgi:hypothetical protein